MHLFLLSPVYPSNYATKGATPVVHYFTKEWVASGHNVHVFHTDSAFPKAFYLLVRPFKKLLDSRLGHLIPTQIPKEYDEINDGVKVTHISLKKLRPHGRFPRSQIQRAFCIISSYIEKEGLPDCFVGHWDNPQLELLQLLKKEFHRPTCLVFHNTVFSHFYDCYGKDLRALLYDIDLAGFRNMTARTTYANLFGEPMRSFIAASGVSKPFIEAGQSLKKEINSIMNFVFVGSLIHRKFPVTIIEALHQSYHNQPFDVTYIGEGDEQKMIQQRFDELKCKGTLTFTGRIPREKVIIFLRQSDVFVMISEREVFGLVYLEAMALGCITIAARHEGIDGIIKDGVNGFLCEAGNAAELSTIITKIRKMSPSELNSISQKAQETAFFYSDVNVASMYINELRSLESFSH